MIDRLFLFLLISDKQVLYRVLSMSADSPAPLVPSAPPLDVALTTTTTNPGNKYSSDFDGVNALPLPPMLPSSVSSAPATRDSYTKSARGKLTLDFSETTNLESGDSLHSSFDLFLVLFVVSFFSLLFRV